MPKNENIEKVLVIGSGPIVIGQAAEFDYAGVQACRALKDEGICVVLVNSNPATIMTDERLVDKLYIEPLNVEVLEYIIEKERPDGLIASLGGQTALNLACELHDLKILERYGVKLLGTNISSIKTAEDRELFKGLMHKIGEPVPESRTVSNFEDAKLFASEIGFPIIIRPAFTLGGSGGGIAKNMEEFDQIVNQGIAQSPINQVLVEKSIAGFKEIEYEVIRDSNDTCIIVCNMENIDPIGIHTGDSFVVAPSQTLSNEDYQMLRSSAIKIIKALKIEGGCNVQYALDPKSEQYYVIEVNPRVSRSSALASKATGVPIAKIATRIAIGYNLDEIKNEITLKTVAAFEPALDYVVVKIPKWPFDKFATSDRMLGTKMKATGEVMAIGRTFEGAFNKAVCSLEDPKLNLTSSNFEYEKVDDESLLKNLEIQDDRRIFRVAQALYRGFETHIISDITKIDPWFVEKIKNIVDFACVLQKENLSENYYKKAKELGFLDSDILKISNIDENNFEILKQNANTKPGFKMVDTCSGEFPSQTPYFYSNWNEKCEVEEILSKENEKPEDEKPEKVLVLGSGPIRIGQGIEFDYCSCHSAFALENAGFEAIMINSNPETLSTDFDVASRLYFEPVNVENVLNIIEKENPVGVLIQFGGQTAINVGNELAKYNVNILGTSLESINAVEDRKQFEALLSELNIPQPKGFGVLNFEEAKEAASELKYPVLVRPSYVIGGRGMTIVYNESELQTYIEEALKFSNGHPILIDKYLEGTEAELDAISDGYSVFIPGINEHIEKAGVHSGDSISVYPEMTIKRSIVNKMVEYTEKIARKLKIVGLMNVQFIIKDDTPYIIEVNPRASRTVPIISKVTNTDMVEIAVNCILGKTLKEQGICQKLGKKTSLVAVKVPVFSFQKLNRIDPALAPEMKSTGEVLGVDFCFESALVKAFQAAGYNFGKEKQRILVSLNDHYKEKALPIVRGFFDSGFLIMATWGTHKFLEKNGIPSKMIEKFMINKLQKRMKEGRLSFVINTPTLGKDSQRSGFQIRTIAEIYSVPCFTSIDTAEAFLIALNHYENTRNFKYRDLKEYRVNTVERVFNKFIQLAGCFE